MTYEAEIWRSKQRKSAQKVYKRGAGFDWMSRVNIECMEREGRQLSTL